MAGASASAVLNCFVEGVKALRDGANALVKAAVAKKVMTESFMMDRLQYFQLIL